MGGSRHGRAVRRARTFAPHAGTPRPARAGCDVPPGAGAGPTILGTVEARRPRARGDGRPETRTDGARRGALSRGGAISALGEPWRDPHAGTYRPEIRAFFAAVPLPPPLSRRSYRACDRVSACGWTHGRAAAVAGPARRAPSPPAPLPREGEGPGVRGRPAGRSPPSVAAPSTAASGLCSRVPRRPALPSGPYPLRHTRPLPPGLPIGNVPIPIGRSGYTAW